MNPIAGCMLGRFYVIGSAEADTEWASAARAYNFLSEMKFLSRKVSQNKMNDHISVLSIVFSSCLLLEKNMPFRAYKCVDELSALWDTTSYLDGNML